MFKKSPKTKQFNLFSSPSGLMCEREGRIYDDESAWHNTFYRDVTSKVDEDIFKPLYTTEREDNRVGRPNASMDFVQKVSRRHELYYLCMAAQATFYRNRPCPY